LVPSGELKYDINRRIHFHWLSFKERWLIDPLSNRFKRRTH